MEFIWRSTDEIYVTVKGKGGHGATPHLNVDPVLIAVASYCCAATNY